MPYNRKSRGRPSSPSEYGSEDDRWLAEIIRKENSVDSDTEEPKTPPRPSTPSSPPADFVLHPGEEPQTPVLDRTDPPKLDLPPLPPSRLELPPVTEPRRRTLERLPDRASATILRVANYRIRKNQSSRRPRMTKEPRSSPFHCRHCQVTCTGRVQWFEHLRSRRHIRRTSKEKFCCKVCDLEVFSAADLARHKEGVHHRLRVRRIQKGF